MNITTICYLINVMFFGFFWIFWSTESSIDRFIKFTFQCLFVLSTLYAFLMTMYNAPTNIYTNIYSAISLFTGTAYLRKFTGDNVKIHFSLKITLKVLVLINTVASIGYFVSINGARMLGK